MNLGSDRESDFGDKHQSWSGRSSLTIIDFLLMKEILFHWPKNRQLLPKIFSIYRATVKHNPSRLKFHSTNDFRIALGNVISDMCSAGQSLPFQSKLP